jgi:hypothetical protein
MAATALLAPAPVAEAQQAPMSPEAFFLSQPPLKADEIPIAADALRLSARNASDEQIDRLASRSGITKERLDFIVTKVSAGVIMIARPDDADEAASAAGTPSALPTPAELELVRAHYDTLAPLFPGLQK